MKRTAHLRLLAAAFLSLFALAHAGDAFALLEAKPYSTDGRIQTVVYSPNEVFKFVGHYRYQTVIEFESGEEVQTISLGDSVAWQVVPAGSRMFVKPVEQDAMTNMTVITDRRTYHFELHAEDAEKIDDPSMVFVMRFIYGRGAGLSVGNYIDGVPDPSIEPEKYNFNYSLSGPDDIAPIRIFDDGEFTYFEFRDKNAEIPAFFLVHGDGSESIINFRTRGDFIVLERVAARFTLRHGEDTVCIFNNSKQLLDSGPTPRPFDSDGKPIKKRGKESTSSKATRDAGEGGRR